MSGATYQVQAVTSTFAPASSANDILLETDKADEAMARADAEVEKNPAQRIRVVAFAPSGEVLSVSDWKVARETILRRPS